MIKRICLECKKEFKVYPYLIKLGYAKFCSRSCRSKYRVKLPEFKKQSEKALALGRKLKGANHPSWKGGVSSENERLRKSKKFREWRAMVFKKDGYSCRKCGYKGKALHPHHIRHFCDNREFRFDVNNGITLCQDCHRKEHIDDARIWASWAKRGISCEVA